jgi:hypothetical protein
LGQLNSCNLLNSGETMDLLADFNAYIQQVSVDFMARPLLARAFNRWLQDANAPRFCWITGGPGSGKTAIAAWLCQISRGNAQLPEGQDGLPSNFLQAYFFCSARDNAWIDPFSFTDTLAGQLAALPQYAGALVSSGGPSFILKINQEVTNVRDGSQVVGIANLSLDLSGLSAEDAFNRSVIAPLRAMLAQGYQQSVIMLVDELHESLAYSGKVNIADLLARQEHLPPQVRWIVTSLPDPDLESRFPEVYRIDLSSPDLFREGQDLVKTYVNWRLDNDPQIKDQAAQLSANQRAEWIRRLLEKAGGNFLYAKTLFDAVARGQRRLNDPGGLPDDIQTDLIERSVNQGLLSWSHEYAPVLGILSVARESLSLAQLLAFSGLGERWVWTALADMQMLVEEIPPLTGSTPSSGRWRINRQSIIDYLSSPRFQIGERYVLNRFYLPPEEWHNRIVQYYLGPNGDWGSLDWYKVDAYAVRQLVEHAVAAGWLEGIEQVYTQAYLARKRQVTGSEIPFLEEATRLVLPRVDGAAALHIAYQVLYELQPNSFRAIRTLEAIADLTREQPALNARLKKMEQSLAKLVVMLASGEEGVDRWRKLATGAVDRDLAICYLAWGLSGQEALQDDLLGALNRHAAANQYVPAWCAAEGLRELGAQKCRPETHQDLAANLHARSPLKQATALYVLSRWQEPSPALVDCIRKALKQRRSYRLAAIAADAVGLLPDLLDGEDALTLLVGVLRQRSELGAPIRLYVPGDRWNYPRRRALRALSKVATVDADLLAELQATQAELDAMHPSPDGEADWRGLSQALAAVISEMQVRQGLESASLPSQT